MEGPRRSNRLAHVPSTAFLSQTFVLRLQIRWRLLGTDNERDPKPSHVPGIGHSKLYVVTRARPTFGDRPACGASYSAQGGNRVRLFAGRLLLEHLKTRPRQEEGSRRRTMSRGLNRQSILNLVCDAAFVSATGRKRTWPGMAAESVRRLAGVLW